MKLESPQHLNEKIVMLKAKSDARELVKKSPHLYIGDNTLSEKYLASLLKTDALLYGADRVECLNIRGWSIVCANKNWLRSESIDLPLAQFFSRILPCDDSGVNSIRSEVIVGAFSSRIFVWDSECIEMIFGDLNSKDTQEITEILSNTEFAVGFFYQGKTR